MAKANNTAMEGLIETLEANRNAFPDLPQFKGLRDAWKNSIACAKERLAEERKQISYAFDAGKRGTYKDASHYYFMEYIDND